MTEDPTTEALLRKLLAQLAEQTDPKEAALAEVGLDAKFARLLDGTSHDELVASARALASKLGLPQTEQRLTEVEVLEANQHKNDELTKSLLPGIPGGAWPTERSD